MIIKINTLDYLHSKYATQKLKLLKNTYITTSKPQESLTNILNKQSDIAQLSVVNFLQNSNSLLLLPNIAIGSLNNIQSVILVTKYQTIQELNNKTIYIAKDTRTSIKLLEYLLTKYYKISYKTKYIEYNNINKYSNFLIIGDTALKYYINYKRQYIKHQNKKYIFDISNLWVKHTNLPSVFAIWAIDKTYYNTIKNTPNNSISKIINTIQNSYNTNIPDTFISKISNSDIPFDELKAYFTNINISLLEQQKKTIDLISQIFNLNSTINYATTY